MEVQDKSEIARHKAIVNRSGKLAEVLDGQEKECVLSIKNSSKAYLNNIGNRDNVVYNPTGQDWKIFKVSIKRYLRTDFIEPAQSRIKDIETNVQNIDGICNKCKRNDSLLYKGKIDDYDFCDRCEAKWDHRFSIDYVQRMRKKMIKNDFYNTLEKTDFPDELIGNWMLLMKKKRQEKDSKHIDNVLREFIRDEIINEFVSQNKHLIKKYQLWQNQ